MKPEKCGCDESAHLRRALKAIRRLASEQTYAPLVDDLAQINNLAEQALKLAKLKGDPAIGDVGRFLEDKP